MSKVGSHDPFGHFKHELWPKEGLRITSISLLASGMRHNVGKFSMKATTLL
jgi:hypothetical protein